MRVLLVVITSFITSLISSTIDKEGYVYQSEVSSLSIEFPGKPESRVQNVEGGRVEEVLFVVDDVEYFLRVSTATNEESIQEELTKFGSRYDMAKKMAANFHARNQGFIEGLIREDWEFSAKKGQQITFKSRRHDHHYRVIIISSTVIEVFVKADANRKENTTQYDQEKVNSFTASLKM